MAAPAARLKGHTSATAGTECNSSQKQREEKDCQFKTANRMRRESSKASARTTSGDWGRSTLRQRLGLTRGQIQEAGNLPWAEGLHQV